MIRTEKRTGRLVYEFVVVGHRHRGVVPEEFQGGAPGREQEARLKRARAWGERFKGDEKAKARAAHLAFEARKDAQGRVRDMPFEDLARAYWAVRRASTKRPEDTDAKIQRLIDWIGSNTLVSTIDDPLVEDLVKRRAGMMDARIRSRAPVPPKLRKDGTPRKNAAPPRPATTPRLLSNADVNRSVPQLLRRILVYGRKRRKLHLPDMPDWGSHLLLEPKRHREMSLAEQEILRANLPEDYAIAVDFGVLTGLRRREIAGLRWAHVDWDNKVISVIQKGDQPHKVPLTRLIGRLLRSRRDSTTGRPHHREAVFTFAASRNMILKGKTYEKGQRYPLNYGTLGTVWARARVRAGAGQEAAGLPATVGDLRLHDATRHTFCSRLLRECGNLRLVQKAVGHSSVSVTERYANVLHEDVARAMAESEARSEGALTKRKVAVRRSSRKGPGRDQNAA